MTYDTMELIPNSSAHLCQDRNCVGNNPTQCRGCASFALLGLASVLGREIVQDAEATYLEFPALAV